MALIIRSSAIHAAGCYTTMAIRKGALVAEYTGSRLTRAEVGKTCKNSPITYLFGLGDGSIADLQKKWARFRALSISGIVCAG